MLVSLRRRLRSGCIIDAMDPSPGNTYEVLDTTGRMTGQLLGKQTVHSHQLWHAVVNVWIINSRAELLMQLRAPDVELSPNVWDVAVGSHVRPGETPTQAAIRAVSETFGLAITEVEIKHLFNVKNANPLPGGRAHNVFGHVFLLRADLDTKTLAIDTRKIAALRWLPLDQLMFDVGSDKKQDYLPRAAGYYPKLFEAFQAWM